eukprot:TRINITY_DN5815_c0_g1_i5.p1 TRINITY_DN5815_c0_g1~~TRINITY_DN5815_c0_g1_i5.p1  ORF type:complete len:618 (-),score=84.92 TRINITY_DN5815_c0_g1_i5:241-2094(-)
MALDFWFKSQEERFNNSVTIKGKQYFVKLLITPNNGTEVDRYQQVEALCKNSQVNYIITPELNELTAQMSETYGKIMVGTNYVTEKVQSSYGNSFTVVLPPEMQFDSLLPLFRNKISTLAVISSTGASFSPFCDGLTEEKMTNNGLRILFNATVDDTWTNSSELYSEELDLASVSGAQGLLLCVDVFWGKLILNKIFTNKVDFLLVSLVPFHEDYLTLDTKILEYVTFGTDFYGTAIYPSEYWWGSFSNFVQQFQDYSNSSEVISSEVTRTIIAGMVIHGGIYSQNNEGITTKDIRLSINYIPHETLTGTITYSGSGVLDKPGIFLQFINGTLRVIAPIVNSHPNDYLIIPIPSWNDRHYDNQWTGSQWALAALSIFCMVISVLVGLAMYLLRENSSIRASSITFTLLMLLGSLFSYASIFIWVYRGGSKATCILTVIFLCFGFCLQFGSLFIKSLRVIVIFRQAQLTRLIIITDLALLKGLSVPLVIYMILIILWGSTSEIDLVLKVVDPLRPSLDWEQCHMSTAGLVFIFLMIAFSFIICLIGCVIAFFLRKIPISVFDESKIIFFSLLHSHLPSWLYKKRFLFPPAVKFFQILFHLGIVATRNKTVLPWLLLAE